MKKRKRGLLKKLFIFTLAAFVFVIACFFAVFVKVTAGVKLDTNKLVIAENKSNVKVFDANGCEIDTSYMFSENLYIKLSELPPYVPAGFVATEDKRFYKHNGVDYRRLIGAAVKNIKNGKLSQGGSTISQQLIKNTHLSREKTLNRKLKEIKLAYKLERRYSKDEILELYLNNIYFGNGCYGIEKASRFYFDKSAKSLTIGEAAMLVGVINAPTVYDPILKQENAEKRKQLVLNLMQKQGVITKVACEKSAKTYENIVKTASKTSNQYLKAVLSEACKKLKVSENQIRNMNIEIYSSLNSNLQNKVDNIVNSQSLVPKNTLGHSATAGLIVLDNKNKSVIALAGNLRNTLLTLKRQPGSTIKPILVYAPAFEYGLVSLESIIDDESITINGYSPTNASKTFSGKVSIRTAIEKSLNIPAVKTLSYVGVERAKRFAENVGINFEKNDQNLALALGGMTKGVTIKQIADAYSTFATDGEFSESSFIDKIVNNKGKVLYENKFYKNKAMSEATAYLVTDALTGVVKNGTAKRLAGLPFQVASKTGTVGRVGSSYNSDAYNVSYTKDYTVVTWIGCLSENASLNSDINGSTYPTEISKKVLNILHSEDSPESFKMPDSVVVKDIDTRGVVNGDLVIANKETLDKYKKEALFNAKFIPEKIYYINAYKTKLSVSMEEGEKPTLKFFAKSGNNYVIYRVDMRDYSKNAIFEVDGKNQYVEYTDAFATPQTIYEYYVESSLSYDKEKTQYSNSIKLMSY